MTTDKREDARHIGDDYRSLISKRDWSAVHIIADRRKPFERLRKVML